MTQGAVAVLAGGLDSGALCGALAQRFERVYPLYVQHGLIWEKAELAHLRAFLGAVRVPAIAPLEVLQLPVGDLYGRHWSLTGDGAPGMDSADDAVYLPGKNLMLLAKAGVWCERHGVGTIALATLKGNPFSDNSPAFYEALGNAIALALGTRIEIIRPYSELSKGEVIRASAALPLQLTFSCIRPVDGRHCGACNKCAERKQGFREAAVRDLTAYVSP